MNKPTLFTRFSAFIKGGEEKDITRFEVKLFERIEREIKERETKISDLREHIVDTKASLNDAVFDINPENIKGIEAAKNYTGPYLAYLQKILLKIETFESQIETLEAEILRFAQISKVIETAEAPKEK